MKNRQADILHFIHQEAEEHKNKSPETIAQKSNVNNGGLSFPYKQ